MMINDSISCSPEGFLPYRTNILSVSQSSTLIHHAGCRRRVPIQYRYRRLSIISFPGNDGDAISSIEKHGLAYGFRLGGGGANRATVAALAAYQPEPGLPAMPYDNVGAQVITHARPLNLPIDIPHENRGANQAEQAPYRSDVEQKCAKKGGFLHNTMVQGWPPQPAQCSARAASVQLLNHIAVL
jgi:hypothetical protein